MSCGTLGESPCKTKERLKAIKEERDKLVMGINSLISEAKDADRHSVSVDKLVALMDNVSS